MLEIINGFLLTYFVTLCTLSTLIPVLVKPIAACFVRPSKDERRLLSEIVKLKSDQVKISMKDEFAAYSKLQRKLNKLETELKDSSQVRLSRSLAIKGSINIFLQVVIAVVIVISVIWFRREPIVALRGDLFPLSTILSYPSDVPNAISTHVWFVISKVSVGSLLKPIVN
ncbi:guided entry of tail-anchored proteins factor 1-like [Danaus plexippus]|uniref:Guided entry of tail-anchored proteins factor 1 n=1 Tax=Danaus plexippus plexippus TaxID=278856 RepID=A0A212EJL4_DANPL|nr:guided entry of tail-anchored proteins factor 1-like [Danaus plexippus]OWR41665.1 tryptophan-rich protein [Danaus plexippus plexippus]